MLLKRISPVGLRGVPECGLQVQFVNEGTVLYGLNGTGKSSIADSIEVLLSRNGRISYFGDIANENQPGWRAASHLRSDTAEVTAELEGVDEPVRRALGGKPVPELERLLAGQRFPGFTIRGLRTKAEILDVSSLDRGRWIDDALGFDEAPKIRAKMQAVARDWGRHVAGLEAQHANGIERFAQDYRIGHGEPEVIRHINGAIPALGDALAPLSSLTDWNARLLEMTQQCEQGVAQATSRREEHLRTADRLAAVLEEVSRARLGQRVHEYRAKGARHAELAREHDAFLVDSITLVRDGRELLSSYGSTLNCPLCEQPLQPRWASLDALIARLDERLGAVADLLTARSELSAATEDLVAAATETDRAISADPAVLSRQDFRALDTGMAGLKEVARNPSLVVDKGAFLSLHSFINEVSVSIRFREVRERRTADHIYRTEIAAPGAIVSEVNRLDRMVSDLGRIQTAEEVLSAAHEVQADLEAFQSAFNANVAAQRREIIGTLADEICAFCREVVERGSDKAKADEFKAVLLRETAEDERALGLRVGFYDYEDQMPQAVLSDSRQHLLSLAIAVCMVRRFNRDFPLVVLDDVLTSLDPEHRMGLADALPAWLDGFQIIVLTNDDKFAARLHEKGFDVQRLFKWTIDEGPQMERYVTTAAHLEEALETENVELASRLLRPDMETWLRARCEDWYGRVYMKSHGNWTLREYWDGLKNSVKETLKTYPDLRTTWDKAEADKIQGQLDGLIGKSNWATHPSGSAATCLGLDGMRQCWAAFKQYGELFRCSCGDWYRRVDMSPEKGVVCSGKRCNLHWMEPTPAAAQPCMPPEPPPPCAN